MVDSRWSKLHYRGISNFDLDSEVDDGNMFADVQWIHPWRLGGTRCKDQHC